MGKDIYRKPFTVKLKGKEYALSPCTVEDLTSLGSFVREELIGTLYKTWQKYPVSGEERAATIQETLRIVFTYEEMNGHMSSTSGTLYMIYRAMLPKHPEITYDEVVDLIGSDEQAMQEMITIIDGLSEITEEIGKTDGGGKDLPPVKANGHST